MCRRDADDGIAIGVATRLKASCQREGSRIGEVGCSSATKL